MIIKMEKYDAVICSIAKTACSCTGYKSTVFFGHFCEIFSLPVSAKGTKRLNGEVVCLGPINKKHRYCFL